MDRIAVLITCHNRREKTLTCLTGLMLQKGRGSIFSLDVYLVDDLSTDGTADAVAESFPDVHIVMGTGNLFWNRGMNLAWKEAARDIYNYYLWLNDDVTLFEESVLIMLNCSIEKNNMAIICGSFVSAVTNEWTYGGRLIVKNGTTPVFPSGRMERCQIINGNFVLVPLLVFDAVGNIDPIFIHAIGDFDYGLRANKKQILAYTTPAYVGYCEKNISLPKWCLPEYSLIKRIANLYSPLGNAHPYYYFIYELRHFGLITALKHYFTIHLRLIIPRLWK